MIELKSLVEWLNRDDNFWRVDEGTINKIKYAIRKDIDLANESVVQLSRRPNTCEFGITWFDPESCDCGKGIISLTGKNHDGVCMG